MTIRDTCTGCKHLHPKCSYCIKYKMFIPLASDGGWYPLTKCRRDAKRAEREAQQ